MVAEANPVDKTKMPVTATQTIPTFSKPVSTGVCAGWRFER
jgi:hypothetical protein